MPYARASASESFVFPRPRPTLDQVSEEASQSLIPRRSASLEMPVLNASTLPPSALTYAVVYSATSSRNLDSSLLEDSELEVNGLEIDFELLSELAEKEQPVARLTMSSAAAPQSAE